MEFFPENILQTLDFEWIKNQLLQNCQGQLGRNIILNQDFIASKDDLYTALNQVHEMHQIVQYDNQLPIIGFDEINFLPILKVENNYLSIEELIILYKNLSSLKSCVNFFTNKKRADLYPFLNNIVSAIYFDNDILKKIDTIIDIEKNQMRPNASPELSSITKQLLEKEQQIQQVFRKIILKYRNLNQLHEQEESISNGRRVLAIKSEHKRQVEGIWLDESSGGTITFIEPQETVHINNEINALLAEKRKEQIRILKAITNYLRPYANHLTSYQNVLAQIDAIRSKAFLAQNMDSTMVAISEDKTIHLKDFRHPLLYLNYKKQNKKVVTNVLKMDKKSRVFVISGPNAGGKSIVLKSLGILQLMFQFGLLLPVAEGSSLPIFKKIFIDVGDSQNIQSDLSTYSAHLEAMHHYLKFADKDTLILIDEMGDGTDPLLGGAIAEAILDELYLKESSILITTHYSNLKVWASDKPDVVNAAMGFDYKTLSPQFVLNTGIPGSSFAFEIAQKKGIPTPIINNAKDKLTDQNKSLEISLTTIQNEKQYVKGLRKNLQIKEQQISNLQSHYEVLKKDLEKERKSLLKSYQNKALELYNDASRNLEKMMREWKEGNKDKSKFLEIRNFIDSNRESLENELKEDILQINESRTFELGQKVSIENSVEIGEIKELRKDSAVVVFGNMVSVIKTHRLRAITSSKPTTTSKFQKTTAKSLEAKAAFDTQIDLRGISKDEAMKSLEMFLDQAVYHSMHQVKIIHGIGTGVLKNSVHQYLKKYKHISHYTPEHSNFGGEGATIAFIK
jgi:DNA mismatch repair protein MutS2